MNPREEAAHETAVITGALGGITIWICGAGLGRTLVVPAASWVTAIVIVPATVPVRTPKDPVGNVAVVWPAGIVKVADRVPLVKPTV